MKKRIKLLRSFIIAMLVTLFCIPSNVSALTSNNKLEKENINKSLVVDARCAIAMDSKSKVVLYEKNSYELVPMASTTKIMTTLVALKYGNLDKQMEVSAKAAAIRGSIVGYKKGEKVTLKELLFGLMLRSGNDAAITIAEGISGSVEEFAKLMNEYASEIGVINTHFETPHGLDRDEHYSTAYDLALVTAKAKENKLFNEIVSAKDVDARTYGFTRSYHNINKILWELPEANGVKTGYTGKAGKCLVTSAKVQGNEVIIVVLNCTPRWKETKRIYEHVNKNYEFKKMFTKGDSAGEVVLDKGTIKLKYTDDIVIPTRTGVEYSAKVIKPQKITSSVNKGDKIGTICVYADGQKIYSSHLEAANSLKIRKLPKLFFMKNS